MAAEAERAVDVGPAALRQQKRQRLFEQYWFV